MKLIIRYHLIILLSLGVSFFGRSQTCLTINAGTNTTTCQGSCANLSAVISQSIRATTSYTTSSIAHAPLPYTGGTNAFAFATDDIWSQPINIGFNFCYFGTNFNQCLVGSNGQITFSTALAGAGNGFNITTALPSLTDLPGNTICGTFRDIDPSQGGFIRTYTTGVAPCRRFVAYWLAVPHFGNGCLGVPTTTFQIVLNETTNDVQVFIDNHTSCAANSNGAGIVGIQNANATIGNAAPGRNFPGAWTATNEGWLFRPNGASATSITWNGPSGLVGTGLAATVCPSVNTTYTAAMVVTQCNGATNTVTSTVQVAVTPTPNIVANSNTTNICPNTPVNLNASGALTYTWNPGNIVGASPVVTPGSTTTYTVIGTGVGSCTSSALVTVTVIPNPTLLISNSSPSICVGGSSTLSATGGVSYTWQPIGVNTSSAVVNPLVSTTYTLLGSNASGCTSSVTTNVAVFALPVVSISTVPNPLCAGSSATLTASGATNYTWSTGATSPSIVTSPTTTSTFSVIGSAVSGCTASATTTVSVIPLFPVIINPSSSTVCPNTSVNLFASAAAINYTWLPVNIFTPTVTVSPSVTTVYTVIASNGTCSNSATATIVTLAAPVLNPVASPTAVCIGNTSTLSASGALTYTWLPGGVNTASFAATPPVTTVFSVSGTNGLGCVSTQTLALTVNPTPTVLTIGTSTAICAGSSGTLNATGATSYTWNPGNIPFPTAIVSPTVTTTYTVVGSTNGCTNTQTATMLVNPTPTVIASTSSNSICVGQTTTLSATGALSYTWNPGGLIGATVNVTPITSTIYTVTGANASNCASTRTIAITVNPLPTLIASATPTAICNAGTVTLTATGANTYTWNPGNLNGSVVTPTLNTTTVYTVTGSSLSGCTNSAIVTVAVNTLSPIAIVASPTAICNGASATLSASGPGSFTWTPGNLTTATIIVTPTVNTTYTVTSTSGACTTSQTLNLIVNPTPVLTTTSNPTFICSGNSATLTATGASTYTWNPGNLTGSSVVVSPAASSIFTVTGTSSLGCTSTRTLILNVIPTPTLTVNASPSNLCLGNTTTLTASGAATYVWNPIGVFSATAFATPLANTVYTVNGSNGLCVSTRTILVTVNPLPTIIPAATPSAICSGNSATLSATGGVTYTWTPGNFNGSSVVVSPTVSTVFTVASTNSLGCNGTATVALTVNPNPSILISASSSSICLGGSATLTATGATNYTWSPISAIGSVVVVNPTVTTNYTVLGSNGTCSSTQTITVVVNPLPILTVGTTSTTLCAGNSATLTASGASTYTWNPGNLTGASVVVTPTSSTVYTVNATSALGCNATRTLVLFVNPTPVINPIATPPLICSGSSATLSATGATSYTWNPGNLTGASVVVSPLVSTTYTVNGTSLFGCVGVQTVALNVTTTPTVLASASVISICSGESTTLTAVGASNYTWTPGNITSSVAVVSPTVTTTYTVAGSTGICSDTDTITIFVNPIPVLNLNASPTAICLGGASTLTASGATSYTWNPGSLNGTSIVVNPTVTTTYSVVGTNPLGCTSNGTVTVVVNPLPIIIANSSPAAICTGNSATLSATGGTTYTWTPGNLNGANVSVTPASSTQFTVIASDALGCSGSATVDVLVTPTPSITVSASPSPVCIGNSVTLTATGATSFTWDPGTITTPTAVVTPTTTITYTVVGANGTCTSTAVVPVFVIPLPNITATAVPDTICAGALTTLSANGALTYTWLPGSLNGAVVNTIPAASTQFTVNGTDASGCIGTQVVDVVVNPLPVVTIAATPGNSICAGNSVTLSASGANSYTWVPSGINISTIVETPVSTQTFTVFGEALGCAVSSIITITVVPLPTLTITPSASTICAGNQVTLTAAGANTYTWLPNAVNGSVFIDTPPVTTTYTLLGENNGCSNSLSATIVVDVNPTVTASASSNTICSGGSVTLSAIGANTYTWNPGNLTGTSVVVNPTATTTYSLQGENGNGCLSNVDLVTVTVTPAPSTSITASALSICAGSTVSLTALGATSYTWLPSNATSTLEIVAPTTTTTYTLLGDNGGCVGQSIVTVTVSPAVNIAASNSAGIGLCASSTVTLSANGAASYTWTPGNLSGSSVTVAPTVTTTYTVVGDNGVGCTGTAVTTVSVLTAPSLTISSPAFTICANGSTTLNASGANTYTWVPFGITPPSISVSPTVTTTYTLLGSDGVCTASTTVIVFVDASPSLTVVASPTIICGAGSSTLTVSGALSYTWQPLNVAGSSVVVTPTSTTIYSVTGENANGCLDSTTLLISVGTAPSVTALNNGPINCTLTSVTLSANVTATNVAFIWSGPGSYTSAVQNPSGINVPGDYTVTAIDALSGCSSTAVTTVTTDPSVPQLTVTPSGSLSCVTTTVSILAVTNATNASYSWTGPSSFTASAATITVSAAGVYSLTVINLDSNCPSSTVVTVSGNTVLAVTATIIPATCSGTIANNDGSIFLGGYGISDRFDLVSGSSYTGTAIYATANVISASGLITNTLVNPVAPVPYTVRVFDVNGCSVDITLTLTPTSCQTVSPNSDFGLAKAVSTASLQAIDGSYNVTYTVVVQNASLGVLSNVTLVEALTNTFPAPTTFSIISQPVVTNTNSGLVINPLFDGASQAALTLPTSTMAPITNDTIVFQVNIIPNGAFGPFNNSVIGTVISGTNILSDSSQTGLTPDPNSDFNFADNNQPTVLLLDPFRFFGITKEGSVSKKLTDNTYDITYTITVHNRGNDTLRNVIVKDSLFNNTVKIPASYVLKNGPITSGMLIANPAYNGNSDINLILPAASKIAPFTTERIIFTINVVTDTVTIYRNRAIGNALGSGNVAVSDTSNNGSNPDTNNNGIWNEEVDNVSTVLIIKTDEFFIPDVFTPDGDGKNDFFVIKGLNGNVDNSLVVFNRWGNKVYEKTSYDNTWDGIPNVSGTFGSQKLPPGTYYYIFEAKDGSKPITGFIVIQY